MNILSSMYVLGFEVASHNTVADHTYFPFIDLKFLHLVYHMLTGKYILTSNLVYHTP